MEHGIILATANQNQQTNIKYILSRKKVARKKATRMQVIGCRLQVTVYSSQVIGHV